MKIDVEAELADFLQAAAATADTSVNALLRAVLHVVPLAEDPRFLALFKGCNQLTTSLIVDLDTRLRILNPGLHHVYRLTYLGYRREAEVFNNSGAERSQVFLSIVPREKVLRVVLPLPPENYMSIESCRDLTHQGHHGVGDLQLDVLDTKTLDSFLTLFSDWLHLPGPA